MDRIAILNAYSHAEAAQILGMTLGSVRVLACRLRHSGALVEKKRGGRPRRKVLEAMGDAWAADGEPECAGVCYAAADRS